MEGKSLSILVALHGGGLSGIDTYAEQVALAATLCGHRVTLIATGERAAEELRDRAPVHVVVRHTSAPGTSRVRRAARKLPTLELAEMRALLVSQLEANGDRFDVAHLNHPALAPAVRPYAKRVVAGAWFYPHRPAERMIETWRHTGATFPRSAGFAAKGLAHYLNDRRGFRRCDAVAAPTEALAADLRSQGINAVTCPPPVGQVEVPAATRRSEPAETTRILVCCGDLGHPRKNVSAGVRATGVLAGRGRRVELVLVGANVARLDADLASLPWSVVVRALGRLPREAINALMQSADLLLMPSLYEEWGYVATESMMVGTPVAAFPVYPFAEILTSPLGACARSMSPTALAAAMERLLEAKTIRTDVRRAAVSRFGVDASARRLEALWTSGLPEQLQATLGAEPSMAR